MKVALIGGTGYVGSYIIDELIKNVDCFLYGFEPNEEEFIKLNSTDKKKYFSDDLNYFKKKNKIKINLIFICQ